MHFPSVSDFPPISEKLFSVRGKFSQFHLFPKTFSIFIRKSDDFLVIHSDSLQIKFRIFPLFSLFQYTFPPISGKIIIFPLLLQISLMIS